jgi:hypothetical protein
MTRLATLLLLLAALALIRARDRDGRFAGGDLTARAFGYLLRVEFTIQRSGPPPAAPPLGVDRCMLPDSLTRAVAW